MIPRNNLPQQFMPKADAASYNSQTKASDSFPFPPKVTE